MIRIFIILLFVIVLVSCKNSVEQRPNQSNFPIIALIENEPVYLNSVDNLAAEDIYSVQKKYLNKIIEQNILKKEADNRNLSIQLLLVNEVFNKTEPANMKDFENFRQLNPYINTSDVSKLKEIKSFIESVKRNERQQFYIDSLIKNKYNVKILLEEPIKRINGISALSQYYKGNINAKHSLYIISDYNCTVCKEIKGDVEKIADKYKNKMKFYYIYFSDEINLGGLAMEAAGKQGKFYELKSILYEKYFIENDTNFYLEAAAKIGIDTIQFMQDVTDDKIYKKLSDNFYFLQKHEIYSVPRFVFDDILLPDTIKLDQLDSFIKNKIKN